MFKSYLIKRNLTTSATILALGIVSSLTIGVSPSMASIDHVKH